MLAGYWIAVDYNNNAYVFREVYQSNLLVSEARDKIKEMTNKEKDIRREWMEFKQKSHKQEKVIVTKENINKVFSQIFN